MGVTASCRSPYLGPSSSPEPPSVPRGQILGECTPGRVSTPSAPHLPPKKSLAIDGGGGAHMGKEMLEIPGHRDAGVMDRWRPHHSGSLLRVPAGPHPAPLLPLASSTWSIPGSHRQQARSQGPPAAPLSGTQEPPTLPSVAREELVGAGLRTWHMGWPWQTLGG